MPYWQLFYHLVWSTRDRQPLLTPRIEKEIHGLLTSKAVSLNAIVYAVGGTVDHVHMVVSIPPAISVSRFVGQVKGASSALFNRSDLSERRFQWQDQYGAFSFDAKRLPNHIEYVEKQKMHHRNGSAIPVLERMTAENRGPRLVHEGTPSYTEDARRWRDDLMAMEEMEKRYNRPRVWTGNARGDGGTT